MSPSMHADEAHTDVDLVRRLLTAQFPYWAYLPLAPVPSAGTDNALYRLGDDLAVRLPRIASVVGQVDLEQRWLPWLAPQLPVAIPEPLAKGEPAEGFTWSWSVYRWLDGENPTVGGLADPGTFAADLAEFVTALHKIDPAGGPPAGRGVPLIQRDEPTRRALAALHGMSDPTVLGPIDLAAATKAWDDALRAPDWAGAPVWIHADLAPGNLLTTAGRLSAVIDFGLLGVGDPACDLIPAWNLLPAGVRDDFRAAVGVDDATWARGRGWALSISLIQLPYYHQTNPTLADSSRHVIAEILAEQRSARP